MIKKCAVTGSFDPVTIGHVNIVNRAKEIFDKVYVLMLINPDKKYTFDRDQRLLMLNKVFEGEEKVEVVFFDGYTTDFCKERGINTLVRGIRDGVDFEYEKDLAKQNYDYGKLETLFFIADKGYEFVSSSLIRQAEIRDKYWDIIPECIRGIVKERFNG